MAECGTMIDENQAILDAVIAQRNAAMNAAATAQAKVVVLSAEIDRLTAALKEAEGKP